MSFHAIKSLMLAVLLLVSACSQSEQPFNNGNGKQSATAVKSQTQTLSLKSLSDRSSDLIKLKLTKIDSNKTRLTEPNLRGVNALFLAKISDVQVEDSGKVIKILADDHHGSRHQKFLVKVSSGQTLLFAHNIDLAPRIDSIQVGDFIHFRGEYVYNPKGGIVHWTHRDPQGGHFGGWIKHNGNTYQ